MAAVWTYPTVDKQRTYGQALEGIRTHAEWIARKPTIILGDFDSNASWPKNVIPEVCRLLEPPGRVSAYHTFFQEDLGKETHPTWYQYGHQEDWCGRKLSDHVPLIVDLNL